MEGENGKELRRAGGYAHDPVDSRVYKDMSVVMFVRLSP